MACKRIKIRNLEVMQRKTVDDIPSKRKIPRAFSRKDDDSNCESQMSTATNYETDCHDIRVDLGMNRVRMNLTGAVHHNCLLCTAWKDLQLKEPGLQSEAAF